MEGTGRRDPRSKWGGNRERRSKPRYVGIFEEVEAGKIRERFTEHLNQYKAQRQKPPSKGR